MAQGQAYVKLNTFTTDHGLPSNHVYDIVEDNTGFLWIATDNGVCRFDGKYFQKFSTKDGLPANDVLQVIKEKNGTIWLNCYKQPPAYFDEKSNKFVVIGNSKKLTEISKSLLKTTVSTDEHLIFFNSLGTVALKNKKPVENNISPYELIINDQKTQLSFSVAKKNNSTFIKALFKQHDNILDSIFIKSSLTSLNFVVDNNKLYILNDGNSIYELSVKSLRPFIYSLETLSIPEKNSIIKLSTGTLNIIGKTGSISILDKATFKLKHSLNADPSTNCVYIDHGNRLWVGSIDKGLMLYSKNSIKSTQTPEEIINNNFLSVGAKKYTVVAGNFYGQILKIEKEKQHKIDIPNAGRTTWLRKLIYTNKGFLAIHDLGYSLDFKASKPILAKNGNNAFAKNAILLNDSLVIIGTNSGVIKLNLIKNKTTVLSTGVDMNPSLARIDANSFYYISATGLARYNISNNNSTPINLPKKWADEKFTTLAFSNDGYLWIGTGSGELLVLKENKVISVLTNNTGLPESINCILAYQNRIWLGSKTGIYVLDYREKEKKFSYAIINISKTDGLPSNTINDFDANENLVYAATENGIAIIPAGYRNENFEIKPQLTEVKINQITAQISNKYDLKSNQNNITLQFAGIELSGHFKNLQYAINGTKNWNTLIGNTLNIQLISGKNTIYVRAIDVNNCISKKTLALGFFLQTPFFKTIWFWALMAILLTAILFWLYNRNKLARQQIAFQQQLALAEQRSKITADLHDDIGATLSSLQLNSAIANQLIHKDPKKTQKILDKIENQAKNLADKIGDIIWSMKPGKDEFMTIGSRIKNFANDILGATDIDYKVEVDSRLNAKIQNIAMRKNIVFIAKEAINNAAKYSKAKQLNFSLKQVEKNILLTIADDGIGFDNQQQSGNGIANMRRRTDELKGIFSLVSTPNAGTIISVTFPLIP